MTNKTQTILILASNPIQTERLRFDQEEREIGEGLRRSARRELFNLESRLAVRADDLRRALLDTEPDIVHFIGHSIDKGPGMEGIVLEDSTDSADNIALVTGDALATLFDLVGSIQCVVLNACYSDAQANAIVEHVPHVVGMRQEISDAAAIKFTTGFYDALGAGRTVAQAFEFGCSAIEMAGLSEDQTPILLNQPVPTVIATEPMPDEMPSAPPACPYPGMRAFDESNSTFFYGRRSEIGSLQYDLHLYPFRAVIGPSGSGKSSLIMAGLIPALYQDTHIFGDREWVIKTMRPGEMPLDMLTEVLTGERNEPGSPPVDLSAWQFTGASQLENQHEAKRLLLVIDQFEETFTFADQEQARLFQTQLVELIKMPGVYLILTVRADFYVDLMNSPLWPQISAHRLEVLPLKAEGLREAIVSPAADQGVVIEEALVTQLLEDAADEPGVLPFVQETLFLLWREQEGGQIPAHAYSQLRVGTERGLNGLYVAMTRRADHTFANLSPDQKPLARRILLRLIQFGEGRADTRRQQTVTNLRSGQEDQALFDRTLATLTTERLLTLSGEESRSDQTSERRVDIAHESLLNGWPTLQTWIDERRGAELTRRRLEEKAVAWLELKRVGGLLDDVALVEAEEWLDGAEAQELGASQELSDLVTTSRMALEAIAERERQSNRLRLALVSAVTLLIFAVLVGGIWSQSRFAAQENRSSNINRAKTIRGQSQIMLDRNAECSLALALNAYDLATTIDDFAPYSFQDSVRDALQATRTEQVLPTDNALHAVVWSHDGRIVAGGGQPGGTQLWEATDEGFQETTRISNPDWVGYLAFSPNDSLLAIGRIEIALWDPIQEEAVGTLRGHSGGVRVLAWHPNGRWLASGSDDGTVIIWDTQELIAVETRTDHQQDNGIDDVMGLAWSPDGTWLASAGWDNRIRIWDASGLEDDTADEETLTLEATWWTNDQGAPLRLAWSPISIQLAASYNNGVIQLWSMDTASGFTEDQQPTQILEAHTGVVWGIAWSPDGSRLASSGEDQTVRIWAGQPLKLLTTLNGHNDAVTGGVAS